MFFFKTASDVEALKAHSLQGKEVDCNFREEHVLDLFLETFQIFTMRGLSFTFHCLDDNKNKQDNALIKIAKAIASSPFPTRSLRFYGIMLPLPKEFAELAGPFIETLFLTVGEIYPQAFLLTNFSRLKYFSLTVLRMSIYTDPQRGLFHFVDLVKDEWLSELVHSLHGKNLVHLSFDMEQFEETKFPLSIAALAQKLSECESLTLFESNLFFEDYDEKLGEALKKTQTLKEVSLKGEVSPEYVKDIIALPLIQGFHCKESNISENVLPLAYVNRSVLPKGLDVEPDAVLFPFLKKLERFSWKSLETSTLALFNVENLKEFSLENVFTLEQLLWIVQHFIPRFSSKLRIFQIHNFGFEIDRQQGIISCLEALYQNKNIEQLELLLPWCSYDNDLQYKCAMERLLTHSFAISELSNLDDGRFYDLSIHNFKYWIRCNKKRIVLSCFVKEVPNFQVSLVSRILCLLSQ
jgi:hypothetical protein